MIGVTKYVDFVLFVFYGIQAVDRCGFGEEVISIWKSEDNVVRIINKRWAIDHERETWL